MTFLHVTKEIFSIITCYKCKQRIGANAHETHESL